MVRSQNWWDIPLADPLWSSYHYGLLCYIAVCGIRRHLETVLEIATYICALPTAEELFEEAWFGVSCDIVCGIAEGVFEFYGEVFTGLGNISLLFLHFLHPDTRRLFAEELEDKEVLIDVAVKRNDGGLDIGGNTVVLDVDAGNLSVSKGYDEDLLLDNVKPDDTLEDLD
ncbi:hypothetical protein CC78DRAFT_576354 [Lojkania enalia]|uniref:Uncharacterized protein n=1 Tax=Lojkania enalia TaxID=147567 RepID=A0A9P4KFS6_9PLEO|nr:hypothetical protein CC78DRAFT_576354 [Didymosphaeria enalia]